MDTIGTNCWDIIDSYISQLEVSERYAEVVKEYNDKLRVYPVGLSLDGTQQVIKVGKCTVFVLLYYPYFVTVVRDGIITPRPGLGDFHGQIELVINHTSKDVMVKLRSEERIIKPFTGRDFRWSETMGEWMSF